MVSDNLAQAVPDVMNDSLPRLDALDDALLFRAIQDQTRASGGRIGQALAARLDRLFSVRCVRLLRSEHTRTTQLQNFEELIARVGGDLRADELDGLDKRYHSRWSSLRDLLSVALSIDEEAEDAEEPAGDMDSLWQTVASLLRNAGRVGLLWTDIAQALEQKHGPRSKSGISNLLSSMRNAKWIETVQEGRRKRIVPTMRLLEAKAVASPDTSSRDASTSHESLVFLRKTVCLNQGKLIEYDRVSSIKHAEMRVALEGISRRRASKTASDEPATQKLGKCLRELDAFLQGTFSGIAQKNFTLLREYFSKRSDTAPRICIKGNWRVESGEVPDMITAVIRDSGAGYDTPSPVDANSAFKRVVETGLWCLMNNLPNGAVKGVYHNPRFDYAAIERLRQSAPMQGEDFHLTHSQWLSCWADHASSKDPRQFYQSTLVVPMTLRNNNLSRSFLDSLDSEWQARGLAKQYDRTLVGFLCIDHVDQGFFNESDIEIAYVFADLLSVYLFKWIGLTMLSKTYKQARQHLSQPVVTFDNVSEEAAHRYFADEATVKTETLELAVTTRNQLLPVFVRREEESDQVVDETLSSPVAA